MREKIKIYRKINLNFYVTKGLFRSDIRLNFFGNPVLQSLRNGESKVFDNDMFSSAWIVTVLLEANLYGKGAPVFESSRLDLTLNAIQDFKNRNDENNCGCGCYGQSRW